MDEVVVGGEGPLLAIVGEDRLPSLRVVGLDLQPDRVGAVGVKKEWDAAEVLESIAVSVIEMPVEDGEGVSHSSNSSLSPQASRYSRANELRRLSGSRANDTSISFLVSSPTGISCVR